MNVRILGLALAGLLTIIISSPSEAADDPVLVQLFERWADRTLNELRLDGAPPPSRAAMSSYDYSYYRARAAFGGLVTESEGTSRPTKVEVVVGDDTLNSSRFQAGRRASQVWQRLNLVVEDVPIAIERDLWMATDSSYKAAVATLQAKSAGRSAVAGEAPPDWSSAPKVRAIAPLADSSVDGDTLRQLAIDTSAALRDLGGLHQSSVRVGAVNGTYVHVDSDGISVAQPLGYAVVRAYASVRRPDGVEVDDERQWVARTVSDLPTKADLIAQIASLGSSVLARSTATPVDYYEGPVIFEGEAAADFFRYLLPPELRGTPPVPNAGESYDRQTRSGPRLGRKLLPDDWVVVDDPRSAKPGQAGGFDYDLEGVAAEPVTLADDGWVRGFVMSRTPRKGVLKSNGHARGSLQSTWQGRLSLWTVAPPKPLPAKRFDREVEAVRRGSGQERVLVVRRMGRSSEGTLPRPTDAVWRAADGSEVPALSVMFQNVDRRTLRDLGATSGEQQRAYLGPFWPGSRAGTDRGLPMVIRAPERVIVQNMEAVFPGPDAKPHLLDPNKK